MDGYSNNKLGHKYIYENTLRNNNYYTIELSWLRKIHYKRHFNITLYTLEEVIAIRDEKLKELGIL
jgi:hypothetical protein